MRFVSRYILSAWCSVAVCVTTPSLPSSWSYAALGDSYASGDGAGSSRLLPNLDVICGRFSEAYPYQVEQSHRINVTQLRYLACGGAVSTSVLRTQIPLIRAADIVSIQVGGNEVDFFVVLNECVHKWRPFSSCEKEVQRARGLVLSTNFLQNFDAMVAGAVKSVGSRSRILVLGYARFFNDQSEQCDHISFSRSDPDNLLTKELRRELNSLVDLLNDVIKSTAEAHGATYVDIDDVYEGHRFCEDGADEPSQSKAWFYNDVDAEDRDRHTVQNMISDQKDQQSEISFPNPFDDFLKFTRTFHPTVAGHKAIGEEVVAILQNTFGASFRLST